MRLGGGPDAKKAEFCEQSTLVDFLQESGAKGVGDSKTAPSTRSASALARNDPTLLAKSDPPPPLVGWRFVAGQDAFLPTGKCLAPEARPPSTV